MGSQGNCVWSVESEGRERTGQECMRDRSRGV